MLGGVLDRKLNIDMSNICDVTSKRHDIVHRNCKNKDGENLVIDAASTLTAVKTVEEFANNLRLKL